MIGYRAQLTRAIRAVAVTSPTSYTWFGRRSWPLQPEVTAALAADARREYLVEGLRRELYGSFYTQGRPVPVSPGRLVPASRDHAFVEALSRANTGAGGWEPGWRVERVEPGIVVVAKYGLHVRAPISACRGSRRAGARISLRRPKERGAGSTGFYTALGDAEPAACREDVELRLYFNVTAGGAVPLVATCTRLLNEAKVPFNLKLANHATGFRRCDAAVLYLEDGGFDQIRGALPEISSACAPHLRSDPPAFAKPLAFGVAIGEHRPGLGASFGTSRCRLVAEGIVAAHESGADRLADRVDAVAGRFADHGLDIEAPYLAPGSSDRYEL
jgi:class II lanthipeptide synthase